MSTVGGNLRSGTNIYLIGATASDLPANRIPTNKELLKYIFHLNYCGKRSLKQSISEVSKRVSQLKIDGVSIRRKNLILREIYKLYNQWRKLRSNQRRNTRYDQIKRREFLRVRDKQFSCINITKRGIIDSDLFEEEWFSEEDQHDFGSSIKCEPTISEYTIEVEPHTSRSWFTPTVDPSVEHVPKINLATPRVSAALERTGTTNRTANLIFEALILDGHTKESNVEGYAINRETIRRTRIERRKELANQIKELFNPDVPLTVHWDGKLLPDLSGNRVDRLAIVVTGEEVSKLLAVPSLPHGTAATETAAIKETLEDWDVQKRVVAMSFDTTSVNSGAKNGVIVQLPRILGRKMLALACRHHVAELIFKHVFEIYGENSRSNNVDDFKPFQKEFNAGNFKTDYYRTIMDVPHLKILCETWRDDIILFCKNHLIEKQPRDDYREFLELVIMFLGDAPPSGRRFYKAGSLSRARWMGRAIYVLKIWMLGHQQGDIDANLMKHYETLCVFIAQIYAKYWFSAKWALSAPRIDLELWNNLKNFFDPQFSKVGQKALQNHLWYLSEINVGMAFFDDLVSLQEKKNMLESLNRPRQGVDRGDRCRRSNNGKEQPHKETAPTFKAKKIVEGASLSEFVSEATKDFFEILEIDSSFLSKPPDVWVGEEIYRIAQRRVAALQVVNDVAERAVKLISDYNLKVTRDPEQQQFLLQVVEHHRKDKPLKK